MPDIVLTTLNAKFIHAAFGLRYLFANLGELQPRAVIAEFDINLRPLDIAEALLAREPKIIGFGIYIWNVEETTEVITTIKKIRPEIKIILGGPEVSHETEEQKIVELADHVITGEADLKFAEVCRSTPRLQSAIRNPQSAIAQDHRRRAAGIFAAYIALRFLHGCRHRASHRVCRGVARLSVHLRILLVVTGHSGAAGAAG